MVIEDDEENALKLRRIKRQRKEKYFGLDFEVYLIEGRRNDLCTGIPYLYGVKGDLVTYNEAMIS